MDLARPSNRDQTLKGKQRKLANFQAENLFLVQNSHTPENKVDLRPSSLNVSVMNNLIDKEGDTIKGKIPDTKSNSYVLKMTCQPSCSQYHT